MNRLFFFVAMIVASKFSFAACNQTVNPGVNLASVVSSAPNGSTICMNTGDYGVANLSNIARTGFVTLQSTSGNGAAISPRISNSAFIKFQMMTLRDMLIQNCSTNIQVLGNTWAQDTSGIVVTDNGFNCSATNKKILIDGNKFVNTRPAWAEGKIGLVSVNGVVIRAATGTLTKAGRPPIGDAPKQQVTLRLPREVLAFFKAGGPGWQTRIGEVLSRHAAGHSSVGS